MAASVTLVALPEAINMEMIRQIETSQEIIIEFEQEIIIEFEQEIIIEFEPEIKNKKSNTKKQPQTI